MLYAVDMNVLLERFTYKTGWHFRAENNFQSPEHIFLYISFITDDTYNPGKEAKIGFKEMIRPQANEEQFWATLLAVIDKVERHETREFFKVDGRMPFDPHRLDHDFGIRDLGRRQNTIS